MRRQIKHKAQGGCHGRLTPVPAGLSVLLVPGAAWACALPPSVILTLPTRHYITAAALTVALTALLAALAGRLPQMGAQVWARRRDWLPASLTSYVSFLAFLGLVLIGFFGPRDPMHNLMTLVFWTVIWIVVPLASAVFGNIWRPINPWTGPVRIARTLLGRSTGIGLARLGAWPAIGFYLWFIWFQMISSSPDDPAVLAQAALTYWAIIFVLAVAEGEDWLEEGEFFTLLFGFVSRIAPLWAERQDGQLTRMIGWPGAQVLRMAPLSRGSMVFIALVLSALTFEGLSETFFWQGLIGQNPLEPMGRSAVAWQNSFGLLAVFALTLSLLAIGMQLGEKLSQGGMRADRIMLSFLAIASGYHGAHYLMMLLTAGQYTLAALNDPFMSGDSWLGLPPFYVSFGFLTDARIMPLLYGTQFVLILGAHLLAVVLSFQLSGPQRPIAHLPLTILMVGYTVLGLWLLSTARSG
ncbi:hypothetical protein Q9295_14855 [Xinfangfangia sp. CPCC 101601]|uniref:Uncharacterized protein n=1 Tax=Pseudogemmobacter lacusdianii TaxID=3069608 RepID=A0ABU0W0V9_9RHOB|nr:hypothetical protein [Xinfangfangia sp. CPCC 101601]MDQ2067654.1 hypothetical protein [Xinfangfangia sp. CPCC 101601]